VLLCKVPLALAVLTLLLAFALTEKKYHAYEEYFALLSLGVLGQAFLPVWFFQGIEQMAYITVFTVVARLVYVVMVLTLVVSPRQYELVAVANGVSWIAAALTGLFIMVRIGYRPTWPGLRYSRQVFKESTGFFWSRAALATYTAGGSVYLGITSSPTQVAYYAAAQQLYNGAQSLLTPVSQALYPHMARERNFALLFKVIGGFTLLSFAGLAVGVIDGRWILRTLYGPEFVHSYPVLLGFLVVFLLAAPSTLLGYPFLGALGRIAKANTSVLYGGLLQVAILIALYVTSRTDAFDVVLAIIGVELLVIVLRLRSGIPAYLALVPGGAHRGPA
jgi:PST family polysaccharide transporter